MENSNEFQPWGIVEPEHLLTALRQAALGEMVISDKLTPILAANLRSPHVVEQRNVKQLTGRELDILKLISQGLSNKLIGRKLEITESTVKVHVKHLLRKMKFKSRVEAAVWALQEKVF